MGRGWALGSASFKKEMLQEHRFAEASRAWDAVGAKELREARWQEGVDAAVAALPARLKQDVRKSAPWKVAVATHLMTTTDVRNGWQVERLDMRSGVYVSKHVGLARRVRDDVARLREIVERKTKSKT